jgi:hypothetical protein
MWSRPPTVVRQDDVERGSVPQMEPEKLTLVRIVSPHFVAGIETDGTVRRAAPIVGYMVGWSDDQVRTHVKAKGWTASIIPERQIIQHEEVRYPGGRKFFYFDEDASRRAASGRPSKEQALQLVQVYLTKMNQEKGDDDARRPDQADGR